MSDTERPGWDARDDDLENRIKGLPWIMVNGVKFISHGEIVWCIEQMAKARRAYRVEESERIPQLGTGSLLGKCVPYEPESEDKPE